MIVIHWAKQFGFCAVGFRFFEVEKKAISTFNFNVVLCGVAHNPTHGNPSE